MWNGDLRVAKLLELIALAGLAAGVVATWPLWTGDQHFPQIPWLAAAVGIPTSVDPWLLGLAGVAGIGIAVSTFGRPNRQCDLWSRIAFAVATIALVLLNQHRMQAWVLHLLGVMFVLGLAPNRRGLSLVRAFAISVYVHSAVSRCDRASLELQWNLAEPLLERWDIDSQYVSERARLAWAGLFAVVELGVSILLAFPRVRPYGRWAAIAMHGCLLLLLGPLGLDHHTGVLVWNATWIAQNWVLFSAELDGNGETAIDDLHGSRFGYRFATVIAGVLICAPLLAPWSLWDNWPSWRLYSGRPASVLAYVDESRIGELPETVRQFVGPPQPLSEWRPVSLDAWSFAELRCPVYPQERFRLAIAQALARKYALGDDLRTEIGTRPERWKGEREMRELLGERAIEEECDRFVVNTAMRVAE